MKQETLDFVTEKTHDLMNASSCCREAKAAAQAWLDAVGTENEHTETAKYIKELEGDILPIDELIAFARSERGAGFFGADGAAKLAARSEARRAAGEKYCDCPACAAAAAILGKKDEMV